MANISATKIKSEGNLHSSKAVFSISLATSIAFGSTQAFLASSMYSLIEETSLNLSKSSSLLLISQSSKIVKFQSSYNVFTILL